MQQSFKLKIKDMKKFLAFLLITISFTATQESADHKIETIDVSEENATKDLLPLVEDKQIKNVILMIGDGTGLAQIASGQLAVAGPDGLLHMQTMPVTGIVKTHSSDNLITDSAAGATAYSCGLKTYNGAIGVDPNQIPCKTILELAEEKGLSTGLVSTSSITHATPASFASHVVQRSMQEDIAADFLDSGVEVFLGGGVKWFHKDMRSDSLDLLHEFQNKGYEIILDKDRLSTSSSNKMLGLFSEDGLERTENEPSSKEMVSKALENLNTNDNGFFLMVEGSQIDWAGHDNNVEYLKREVQDFDEAVQEVLEFAREDGETLVVLTADHETGGMTMQRQVAEGDSLEVFWTTDYHTGIPVPLMAYGPQATEFMGWRDNTYVGIKIAELLGLGEFPILE